MNDERVDPGASRVPATSDAQQVRELPVVFDCEGSRLVGMVHVPAQVRSRGLLFVVAGGPQYRGGVCRMQVQMARDLASQGVPVMRFDYRGLGDSEGEFQGFTSVTADLAAALRTFAAHVPDMREVVLWGGCDAASAGMISGWRLPSVTGLVLGNPWVHSDQTGDLVAVKHYGQRIRDRDFWLKVLRGGYNPWPAARTLARAALGRLGRRQRPDATRTTAVDTPDDTTQPFQARMCTGLSRFGGDVLLLMSGRSLISKEFDELAAHDPAWRKALLAPRRLVRVDIAEADQAFSGIEVRREVGRITAAWMLGQPLPDAARELPR